MMKRYLKVIVTTIIFFMSSVVGFAQNWTIDGVVLDKKSNKPVEFATVILGNT